LGKGSTVLKLTVNGKETEIASDPETPLAYVLRNELKLKGTKIGCGLEQCGACAVLVDGDAVLSCTAPAATFEGRDITTVECLGDTEAGRTVQEAFVAARAAQCGFCTAGLEVRVTAMKAARTSCSREDLKAALAPHLCRCGSHPRVLRAAEAVLSEQS
jgi:aerobic-type carbon monoxide dehydrogenase small subunit (CoxS/CutS family)